jgi:hypothetical protein
MVFLYPFSSPFLTSLRTVSRLMPSSCAASTIEMVCDKVDSPGRRVGTQASEEI